MISSITPNILFNKFCHTVDINIVQLHSARFAKLVRSSRAGFAKYQHLQFVPSVFTLFKGLVFNSATVLAVSIVLGRHFFDVPVNVNMILGTERV